MLGCDLRDDVELYFSNRTWITLGCGGFLCTRYVPKLEEMLQDGESTSRRIARSKPPPRSWPNTSPTSRFAARVQAEGHRYAHERFSYEKMIEGMLEQLARPAPRLRATPPAATAALAPQPCASGS